MSEEDSVKHEGKWTRDDLPSVIKSHAYAGKYFTRLQELEEYMDTMLDHLNTHYPKPAPDLLSSAAECVLGAEDRVRSAKAERDAAVARAEAAERRHTWPKTTPTGHTYIAPDTYSELCHQHGNAAQAAIESWEADECPPEPTWEMVGIAHREVERIRCDLAEWKARADQLRDERDEAVADLLDAGRVRDEWEARAEKAEADRENIAEEFADFRVEVVAEAVKYRELNPPVFDVDVERTIRAEFVDEGFRTKTPVEYRVVRAVCELFGVKAEPTVDPVEAKARELYEVVRGSSPSNWGALRESDKDDYRRIAAHVLGQEAGDE